MPDHLAFLSRRLNQGGVLRQSHGPQSQNAAEQGEANIDLFHGCLLTLDQSPIMIIAELTFRSIGSMKESAPAVRRAGQSRRRCAPAKRARHWRETYLRSRSAAMDLQNHRADGADLLRKWLRRSF